MLDTPDFMAFCPFASRFPFETWILPKTHSQPLREHPQDGRRRPGAACCSRCSTSWKRRSTTRPTTTSSTPAPSTPRSCAHYHWHIEIIPRLTKTAGFEWGSGFYINPVPPEDAAAFLREVEAEAPEPKTLPVRETG